MILFKISQDKKFASIGKTEQEAEWYVIEPHVEKFVTSIPWGTEVGIKSEKKDNKNHLVFITDKPFKNSKGSPTTQSAPTPEPTSPAMPTEPLVSTPVTPVQPVTSPAPWSPPAKSTEVQASIKRQAIGNMTSRSLVSLQGQLTPENIKQVISDLYAHYQVLVG